MVAQQAYTSPRLTVSPAAILYGDCLAALKEMPDCSVDAIVTDPPYGLGEVKDIAGLLMAWIQDEDDKPYLGKSGFMGQGWDAGVPGPRYWREVYRVMKPGAHLLAFSGTRTYDLLVIALRLSGFECRDQIDWVYGAGFPKSMDISKAIDRHLGKSAERQMVGYGLHAAHRRSQPFGQGTTQDVSRDTRAITSPATLEAARYAGYGTALKPSHEPICLARKPLSEPTIAQNVLVHGCGGLNIDATRIGTQDNLGRMNNPGENGWKNSSGGPNRATYDPVASSGRWPSNTLFSHTLYCRQTGVKRVRGNRWGKGNERHGKDGQSIFNMGQHIDTIGYEDKDGMEIVDAWECDPSCPVRQLDLQSGISKGHKNAQSDDRRYAGNKIYGKNLPGTRTPENSYEDTGTAARYFAQFSPSPDELEVPFIYSSKACRAERNRGCEGLQKKFTATMNDGIGKREHNPDEPNAWNGNNHPTVKSLQLMRYLCRLVGVPGGVILDPFMGSGSTGVAALQEGFSFIGIEQSEEYCTIANARIAHAMQEVGIAEVQGDGEWECHESCPVRILGEQSGVSKSSANIRNNKAGTQGYGGSVRGWQGKGHNDEGTAARYFAQFAPDSLWSEIDEEATHGDD